MINEIVQSRLGKAGDGNNPLGWKKIAKKYDTSLEKIKELRKDQEYYDYSKQICESIGIARLQAKACRKNTSLSGLIEYIFGLDIYSARVLADELEVNPLPRESNSAINLSEKQLEELAVECDKLVIESTNTIALSRKHVKWLLSQGYSASDKMLLRASTMTRHVCSRTTPDFMAK